ncbi:MAG: ferredoxin family protein [Candidatus Bathyarchaeia archaeon]
MPGKITVDWTSCSGAGMCAQVCPMGVWDVEEAPDFNNERKGHPNRPEECIQCMACVASCPTQAITVEDSDEGEAIYIKK